MDDHARRFTDVAELQLELEEQSRALTELRAQVESLARAHATLRSRTARARITQWPYWPAVARALEVTAIVAGVAAAIWTVDATRQQLAQSVEQNQKLQAQIDLQKEHDYIARRAELFATLYNRRDSCAEFERDELHRCPVVADIRAREQSLKALVHIERARKYAALTLDGLDMRAGAGGARRVHLEGIDLSGAQLEDAHLEGASLAGAQLERAHLARARISGADLHGVDLFEADLYQVECRQTSLRDAQLVRAHMNDARCAGADLSGANLADAELFGASLPEAQLTEANLARADLTNADLELADLSDANLEGANLQGANLARANASRARLRAVNLSRAKLDGLRLTESRLSGAVFYVRTHLLADPGHVDTPATLRNRLLGADVSGSYVNCDDAVIGSSSNFNGIGFDNLPCVESTPQE